MPQRSTTITCSISGSPSSTSSTADFIGVGSPRRIVASAVISAFAPETSMRSATELAEKPPKTTLWIAPIRVQASIATAASGTIGMKMPTTSPLPTPSDRRPLANFCVSSSSQAYVISRLVPSSPSQ